MDVQSVLFMLPRRADWFEAQLLDTSGRRWSWVDMCVVDDDTLLIRSLASGGCSCRKRDTRSVFGLRSLIGTYVDSGTNRHIEFGYRDTLIQIRYPISFVVR